MHPLLADMHVHIDSAPDAAALLHEARHRKLWLLVMTCEPAEYEQLLPHFQLQDENEASSLALGLHPWWIARGDVDERTLRRFEQLAPDAAAFGELGLDFHDHHTGSESHEIQLHAFERACAAASASARAANVRKPLSLHTFKAADETLDTLEKTGCLDNCACIFHWFTGSVPQLERAREAGCWFSLNERQLKTGKGREYVKLIPPDKLLLETDLPARDGDVVTAQDIEVSLQNALSSIESARGDKRICIQIETNSRMLLSPNALQNPPQIS